MIPAAFNPLVHDEQRFGAGMMWDRYVARMASNRVRVETLYHSAAIPDAESHEFRKLVTAHGGTLHVTAMTEDWCGDAVVVLPLLARLADQVPGIELRILLKSESPTLDALYQADGIGAIPLLSFFDAAGQEVARWAEHPSAADTARSAYLAQYPHLDALRAAGTPEAWAELTTIFDGWIDRMMELYPDGLWQATLDEWRMVLGAGREGG